MKRIPHRGGEFSTLHKKIVGKSYDTLEWKTADTKGETNFKYNYSFKADMLLLENLIEESPFIEDTSCYIRK